MKMLISLILFILALSACTSKTSTEVFYDGQIIFYATNPTTEDGNEIPWYTVDEAAILISESRQRNDHEKIDDLPFTIESVTDPLALAHYYGYASACLSAPMDFENRTNGEKRFTVAECGDLTSQVVENRYYEQSLTPAP